MKKKKIYKIKATPISMIEWSKMHPFPAIYSSDHYYCKLANRLLNITSAMGESGYYTLSDARIIAMAITAYFEDVISGLGIWRTFITEHKKRYGKWLPWYDTSGEYYEDEVNPQDVMFVMWLNMMTMRNGAIVNPENPALQEMAMQLYEVLEDEFENAPINDDLVDTIYNEHITDEFINLRTLLSWMVRDSYLLRPSFSGIQEQKDKTTCIEEGLRMDKRPGLAQYAINAYWSVAKQTGPLAMRAAEWYALMREHRGIMAHNQQIREMTSGPFYPYCIISNNADGTITMRSGRGKDYDVRADSFEEGSDHLLQVGQALLAIPAYYHNQWHINGFAMFLNRDTSTNAEAKVRELTDDLTRDNKPCDLLMEIDKDVESQFTLQLDSKLVDRAIKRNDGSRLFYFPDLVSAIEWQNETFKLNGTLNNLDDYDNQVAIAIFLTEDNNTYITSTAQYINDPHNPYFDPNDGNAGISMLADSNMAPKEMITYLLDNNMLDYAGMKSMHGDEHGRRLLQDNAYFFATYMRGEQI